MPILVLICLSCYKKPTNETIEGSWTLVGMYEDGCANKHLFAYCMITYVFTDDRYSKLTDGLCGASHGTYLIQNNRIYFADTILHFSYDHKLKLRKNKLVLIEQRSDYEVYVEYERD